MRIKYVVSCLFIAVLMNGCVTKVVNSDGSVQSTVIDKDKLSSTYVNLALEYQKHGAPQVALERINLAIATKDTNEHAYVVRAMIYQQLNKSDDAEKDFKTAISLKKTDPDAYVNYASFLCEQKRYDEAMTNFSKALDNPLYFTPEIGYYNRGKCYYKQGDLEKANLDYVQSLNFKNPPPDSYLALAQLQLDQKNYLVAKYYIDRYNATQTPASMWLHIQILQLLVDNNIDPNRNREYISYRDTIEKVLIDNYGNSAEAQKCLIRYGQPKSVSSFSNLNSSKTPMRINNNSNVSSVSNNGLVQTDSNGRSFIIMPSKTTPFSIAKKYNLTLKQLEQYNNLKANKMHSGVKLYITPQTINKPVVGTNIQSSIKPTPQASTLKPADNSTVADDEDNTIVTSMVNNDTTPSTKTNPSNIPSPTKAVGTSASAISSNAVEDLTPQVDANGKRFIIVPAKATAYSISRKFSLTVKQLEQYNRMKSGQVTIGMKLYLDPQ